MEQAPKKLHLILIYAGLALVTIIAYEPVRHNEFVDYDDGVYIYENPHITGGLTWQSIIWAFTTFRAPEEGHWQPLTRLSHMLDCELFGLNPFWHHLTSLWIHVANTLLLFWVLKRMTSQVWPSAFVAAAFGLHPLHVESVAWATERRDMLSGLFFMLTIWIYIWYTEHPSAKRYLLACLTFAFGLMSKSILVTLPCLLLLLDYWPLRRLQLAHQSRDKDSSELKSIKKRFRWLPAGHLIIEKMPLFILAIVACVFAVIASQGSISQLLELPLHVRIVNSLNSYLGYLVKMVYPRRLAVLYPYPRQLRIDRALLFLTGVAILLRFARNRPWLTVGLLWFIGTLVPVIGLVQVGSQAMADRYSYLPSIGIFIIIAWCAGELVVKWRYQKMVLGISAGAVLAVLLLCTRMQVRHWKDSFTLYERALAVTENNFVVHYNLARLLIKEGQFGEAVVHCKEVLRANPGDFEARNNMGVAFFKQGKYDEAIACFSEVLRLKPDYAPAINNLRAALRERGKVKR